MGPQWFFSFIQLYLIYQKTIPLPECLQLLPTLLETQKLNKSKKKRFKNPPISFHWDTTRGLIEMTWVSF